MVLWSCGEACTYFSLLIRALALVESFKTGWGGKEARSSRLAHTYCIPHVHTNQKIATLPFPFPHPSIHRQTGRRHSSRLSQIFTAPQSRRLVVRYDYMETVPFQFHPSFFPFYPPRLPIPLGPSLSLSSISQKYRNSQPRHALSGVCACR